MIRHPHLAFRSCEILDFMDEYIEDFGWRWPSGAVPTLWPFIERGLQSRPSTARTFEVGSPHFWSPEGHAGKESWVSVAAMHPWERSGFPRGLGGSYWLNLVCEGHSVVRDFVSQFLAAAGCPDLAGQVLLDWRQVEQDRTVERWTSRDAMVPNGLTLDVELRKKRRGRVPSALPAIHHGGRLVVTKDTTIEAIRPVSTMSGRILLNVGFGISLSLRNVVWVGLIGGPPSDGLPEKETALELTEANLICDHLLVVELLKAAGQEHLADLVIEAAGQEHLRELVTENATRDRNDEMFWFHPDYPTTWMFADADELREIAEDYGFGGVQETTGIEEGYGYGWRDRNPEPEPLKEPAGSSTEPEDVVLSVDDLVDSILALSSTPDSALRGYLNERIALLRLELGAVDGELAHSDWLFSDQLFSSNGYFGDPVPDHRVLTLPGLEAPEWLGVPYNKLQDRTSDLWRRSSELRVQIEDLRRTFLRAVLIEAEPALEFRRTTEQRLQQRGLGPRPTPPAASPQYPDYYDW